MHAPKGVATSGTLAFVFDVVTSARHHSAHHTEHQKASAEQGARRKAFAEQDRREHGKRESGDG